MCPQSPNSYCPQRYVGKINNLYVTDRGYRLLKLASALIVYKGGAAGSFKSIFCPKQISSALTPPLSLPLSSFIFSPALSLPVFLLHRDRRKINLTNRSALLISLHLPSRM